jgi:hypothetical protein
MAKFRLETYDVKADSSSTRKAPRSENPDALIIDQSGQTCFCGCGSPRGEKVRFAMGHDMKLKGKLNRAACAEAPVVIVTDDGLSYYTAVEYATEMGWEANVAAALAAFRAPAKPRAPKGGKGVKSSETDAYIKVGRWEKGPGILREFEDKWTFEYSTADGTTHHYTSLDGTKWAADPQ